MLGGNGLGAPVPRAATRNRAELELYVRLEYGGRANVQTLLSEAAHASKKARTNGRSRLAGGIKALIKSLRLFATGHRSKAPTSEV